MKTPMISVLMPAYNTEKYISEAIESILNQKYSNFELLICDDCSIDSTFSIIKKYENDSRVKVYKNSKNIGNLKTTNFLLKQVKGKYITFQDSDDVSSKDRFNLYLNKIQQNPKLGLIGTNYCVTDEYLNPKYCGFLPIKNFEIKKITKKEVPPFLFASVLVKKELVKQLGGFQIIFNRKGFADLDWLSRLIEITEAENIPDICYFYRKHEVHSNKPNSLIGKHGEILIKEAVKQRASGSEDFLEKKQYIRIRKFISTYYSVCINNGQSCYYLAKYRPFLKK